MLNQICEIFPLKISPSTEQMFSSHPNLSDSDSDSTAPTASLSKRNAKELTTNTKAYKFLKKKTRIIAHFLRN